MLKNQVIHQACASTRSVLNLLLFSALLLSTVDGWSRPTLRTVSQTEGDAEITLQLENRFVDEDSLIPCEVSVSVQGENRPLIVGDTLLISVKEDDTFGDDVLFEIEEVVDDSIARAQRFERTYDCSFASIGDLFNNIEVYGKLVVDKQDCGTLCELGFGEDTPATPTVIMQRVTDDLDEDDDTPEDAISSEERLITERVARDADWVHLRYAYPVELLARLESHLVGGNLVLTLYDETLTPLAVASPEAGGEAQSLRPASALNAGEYYLEIKPSDPANFNFYDLHVVESQVMGECIGGSLEERPCGLCGREERVCNAGGEWGPWSQCIGVGECEPGSEESQGCEMGGSRQRVCGSDCRWEGFSECIQCEDGMTEACYTGSEDLAGIGACVTGTRTCSRGQWSSCLGDVLPQPELCNDGIDNDCNGQADGEDPACFAEIGEACGAAECVPLLTCLESGFPDGYCGRLGCDRCLPGSVCGTFRSQEFCLKPCQGSSDCRLGYTCAPSNQAGQNVCIPACTRDQECAAGEVCSPTGVCEGVAPVGSMCGQMMTCTAPFECLGSPFVNGYCGGRDCNQCASGSACGDVMGQPYCLALCQTSSTCQAGHVCAPIGRAGEMLCTPPCAVPSDCGSGQQCNAQGWCEVASVQGDPCGSQGSCQSGYVCAMVEVNSGPTCMPICMNNQECGEGYECSAEQYCARSTTPDMILSSTSTDEGCQQKGEPSHRDRWLWFLCFMILLMKRRRWSAIRTYD